jgi:GT2 family glycosyltransferase
MMLDDDEYLTDDAIAHAMTVLQQSSDVGAVSMPQYDLQGRMTSQGGRILVIKDGVIFKRAPELNVDANWVEVQDLDGGAMLYRTEMRDHFTWDDRYAMYDLSGVFDDIDKSLQIMRDGRWKQAIVPRGRMIHDRSWLGRDPRYERNRLNGSAWRRSYKLFRTRWGLRLDMRSHLLFELAFPLWYSPKLYPLRCHFRRFFNRRLKRQSR